VGGPAGARLSGWRLGSIQPIGERRRITSRAQVTTSAWVRFCWPARSWMCCPSISTGKSQWSVDSEQWSVVRKTACSTEQAVLLHFGFSVERQHTLNLRCEPPRKGGPFNLNSPASPNRCRVARRGRCLADLRGCGRSHHSHRKREHTLPVRTVVPTLL